MAISASPFPFRGENLRAVIGRRGFTVSAIPLYITGALLTKTRIKMQKRSVNRRIEFSCCLEHEARRGKARRLCGAAETVAAGQRRPIARTR
jgi:hypothetical protein